MTTIRDAAPEDQAAWLNLWQQYLDFYGVQLDPQVTARTWSRLMDAASPVKARLAISDSAVVGFAIHHHHASTWVAGDDCYLEDLFVADSRRGSGVGSALLDDLITLARSRGWHRLYWHTDEGNIRARAVYDRYVKTDGHVRYRMKL